MTTVASAVSGLLVEIQVKYTLHQNTEASDSQTVYPSFAVTVQVENA